jgi:hypothetical protein
MGTAQLFQTVGLALVVAGLIIYLVRKDSGANTLKIFGAEVSVSAPSIFVVLLGTALFAFPFTSVFKEPLTSNLPKGANKHSTILTTKPVTSADKFKATVFLQTCGNVRQIGAIESFVASNYKYIQSAPFHDSNEPRNESFIEYTLPTQGLMADTIAADLNEQFSLNVVVEPRADPNSPELNKLWGDTWTVHLIGDGCPISAR